MLLNKYDQWPDRRMAVAMYANSSAPLEAPGHIPPPKFLMQIIAGSTRPDMTH
jgi:hypothetical protein